MKVYVVEVESGVGGFIFDAVYSNKQFALDNVKFWELKESEYRITEHEV